MSTHINARGWEFPKIRGRNISPKCIILALIVETPKTEPLIFGNPRVRNFQILGCKALVNSRLF